MTKNIDALAPAVAKQKSLAANDKFLTTRAAAAILQPFMPSKNAQTWLLLDSQHEPIIPSLSIEGENLYRWVDLANFAIKTLGARLDDIPLPDANVVERRGEERRAGYRRRAHRQVQLSNGIERRSDYSADRRLNSSPDRRKSS